MEGTPHTHVPQALAVIALFSGRGLGGVTPSAQKLVVVLYAVLAHTHVFVAHSTALCEVVMCFGGKGNQSAWYSSPCL